MLKRLILGLFTFWVGLALTITAPAANTIASLQFMDSAQAIEPGAAAAWNILSSTTTTTSTTTTGASLAASAGKQGVIRWIASKAVLRAAALKTAGAAGLAIGASSYAYHKIYVNNATRDPLLCVDDGEFAAPVTLAQERRDLTSLMGPESIELLVPTNDDRRLTLTWEKPYVVQETGSKNITLFHRAQVTNPAVDFPLSQPNGVQVGTGTLFHPTGGRTASMAYTEIELQDHEIYYRIQAEGIDDRVGTKDGLGNRNSLLFPLSSLYDGDEGREIIDKLRQDKTPITITFATATVWRGTRALSNPDANFPYPCGWKSYGDQGDTIKIAGPAVSMTIVGNDATVREETIYSPIITSADPTIDGTTANVTVDWQQPSQPPNGTPKYKIYTVRLEEKGDRPSFDAVAVQNGTYREVDRGNFPDRSATVTAFKNLALAPGESQRLGVAIKANFIQANNRDIGYSNVREVIITRTDDGSNGDAGATYEASEGRDFEKPTDRTINQPGSGGLTEGTGASLDDCSYCGELAKKTDGGIFDFAKDFINALWSPLCVLSCSVLIAGFDIYEGVIQRAGQSLRGDIPDTESTGDTTSGESGGVSGDIDLEDLESNPPIPDEVELPDVDSLPPAESKSDPGTSPAEEIEAPQPTLELDSFSPGTSD